jgi:hypothetical protein
LKSLCKNASENRSVGGSIPLLGTISDLSARECRSAGCTSSLWEAVLAVFRSAIGEVQHDATGVGVQLLVVAGPQFTIVERPDPRHLAGNFAAEIRTSWRRRDFAWTVTRSERLPWVGIFLRYRPASEALCSLELGGNDNGHSWPNAYYAMSRPLMAKVLGVVFNIGPCILGASEQLTTPILPVGCEQRISLQN